jgi:type VI secretion system protein ImpK
MIQLANQSKPDNKSALPHPPEAISSLQQLILYNHPSQHPTTQLLLASHFVFHHPDVGLNPLVDAAAKIFSLIGKLKYLKYNDDLSTLRATSYKSEYLEEYLPIATYTLCVMLDDIISLTPWGQAGNWGELSLLNAFHQERLSHKNFLILLERFIRDPVIYIDIMEFMYICLSLGFKCHISDSEGDQEQLQHINYALYKRIRAYRGNFSKILSPFPIKSRESTPIYRWKQIPFHLVVLFIVALVILLVTLGKFLLDTAFLQTSESLLQTERTVNEKHHE